MYLCYMLYHFITLDKSYLQTSVLLVMSPVTLVTLLSCLLAFSLASPRPEAHYNYYPPYYGYRYYGYYGECDLDSHCSYSTACYKNYCRDPCIGACGYNANCKVVNHVAACACPAGYTGNAASSCYRPN